MLKMLARLKLNNIIRECSTGTLKKSKSNFKLEKSCWICNLGSKASIIWRNGIESVKQEKSILIGQYR